MEEVKLRAGASIDEAVEILLKHKAEGKQVYCDFNGYKLYSDTVTLDSAYMEITGSTKADYESLQRILEKQAEAMRKESQRSKEERERKYREIVSSSRIPGIGVNIEMPKVIAGLKYILENSDLEHEQLVEGLVELGCNFTWDDYAEQFKDENPGTIVDGLRECELSTGADVIINVRDSEYGRAKFKEMFIGLTYDYIRKVTGDENYTRENVESGAYGGGAKK